MIGSDDSHLAELEPRRPTQMQPLPTCMAAAITRLPRTRRGRPWDTPWKP